MTTETMPHRRRLSYLLVGAYAILLLTTTHIPEPGERLGIHIGKADVLAHFCVYAVLGYVLGRAIFVSRRARVRRLLAVCIASLAVFAALDETTQPFVGRTAQWPDFFADVVGASVTLLWTWLRLGVRPGAKGRIEAV